MIVAIIEGNHLYLLIHKKKYTFYNHKYLPERLYNSVFFLI